MNKLVEHCSTNQFFLFGCDSADTATKFYNHCIQLNPGVDTTKFLLITADTRVVITNANEQVKDAFVFYSPKITFGVDFTIEEKQDVFKYI